MLLLLLLQLSWSAPSSGSVQYYLVSVFDAANGNAVGISYRTTSTSLVVAGIPPGLFVALVVNVSKHGLAFNHCSVPAPCMCAAVSASWAIACWQS